MRSALSTRLSAVLLAAMLLLAITIGANSALPSIDAQFGDTTIKIAADRAWALYPGDCVTVRWEVEGIESLHIDWGGDRGRRGEIGWGEGTFCPTVTDTVLTSRVRSSDGMVREFPLGIHFLPALLLYVGAFVGFCGSLLLTAYLLLSGRMERGLSPRWLMIVMLVLVNIGVALRLNEPEPPLLEAQDGPIKARMWADQSVLAFPHECISVKFSVVGAQSLQFNGEPVALKEGWAQRDHCDWQGSVVRLEALGIDGEMREFTLSIPSLFGSLAHISTYKYISIFALLAAFVVYAPMAAEKARSAWRRRHGADFAALACFALLLLMLYLPFGFDSAAQWETWTILAELEGLRISDAGEYMLRIAITAPRALAQLLSSESFVSHHVLQFTLLLAKMTLLYGILRKLHVSALYAFLMALLAFAYPANDLLLSLRSLPLEASVFWLLLAAFCALEYWQTSRRRALVGMALALLMNVNTHESGLALILALPAYLWLRPGRLNWRAVNMVALWFSAAVFKVCHMLLLVLTERRVRERQMFDPASSLYADLSELDPIAAASQVAGRMYQYTFVDGWAEALASLGGLQWLLPIGLSLLCVIAISAYMLRQYPPARPPVRDIAWSLLGGLLFLMPAIGVLMWLPARYSDSTWRLSLYVPIGAAIAIFCLLLLLTQRLQRWRNHALIALCAALLLPGLSRLYAQHDFHTRSADAKAASLYEILELVPHPRPDSHLVLVTALSRSQLEDAHIGELVYSTFLRSALPVLYQEDAPASIYFCFKDDWCSWLNLDLSTFHPDQPGEHLKDTLLLELRDDLSIALVEDPAAWLGWGMDVDYDASRLYDADAPLPPRAQTMLGPALRRGTG